MQEFTINKTVNVPIEKVWANWDDFANIARFNPNIKESFLLTPTDKETGVGTLRECKMPDDKNWVRERILDYRPDRNITLEVYESSMPIKKMTIDTSFKKVSETITEMTLHCKFELKMGVVGKMMGPMMKKRFEPMLMNLLEGNAAYLERGVVANKAA